jgi:hypothetical protein
MTAVVNEKTLSQENIAYRGTSGVSKNNRTFGFLPAFFDIETKLSYVSRFADGRPAPIHLFDGLPESLVTERSATGAVKSVKSSVISGFLYADAFYTRDQVAAMF